MRMKRRNKKMDVMTKEGVWLARINDYFLWFIECLYDVWQKWGDIPTITSGADGKHMEGSLHYVHRAWDVRVWGLHNPQGQADQLRARLNEDGNEWRVLFGDKHHQDHIHVEVHPK
jgi:hypothetical protein